MEAPATTTAGYCSHFSNVSLSKSIAPWRLVKVAACIQTLNLIKTTNAPAPVGSSFYDYDKEPDVDPTDAVAAEIAANLENLVGPAEDPTPKAEPQHPVSDTVSKFGELKFGPNYNPTGK